MISHRGYDTDAYFSFLPYLPHLPTPFPYPPIGLISLFIRDSYSALKAVL
jgi:hypothetical protein